MSQPAPRREWLTSAAIAASVAIGYYLASQVGLRLRLPSVTPSVFWPPNAVVTAALLLVRPARWPIILLALFPAHLAVQLGTEWPLTFISAVFVTNCLEAVIAAAGVRLLSDAPSRLDSFERLMAFFIAAVVGAPILSSFADAAAVHLFNGEPYWETWRVRTLSNILSELTVVPAIVGLAGSVPAWLGRRRTLGDIEPVILAAALAAVGWITLGTDELRPDAMQIVSSQAPIVLELPLLFWAAVRFGPVGAGVSLLCITLVDALALVRGHGPFASLPPPTTVAALTLSSIAVATTMLFMATLVDERRRMQQALSTRLRFEELLSRFTAAFVRLPSDQVEQAFAVWFGRIGEALHLDVVALFVGMREGEVRPIHRWTSPTFHVESSVTLERDFPWALSHLRAQRPLIVSNLEALPAEANQDAATMRTLNLRAGVIVPLGGAHTPNVALACATMVDRPWTDELTLNVRLLGEVIANVLERKETEDALRRSELMKSAILESLTTGVAVVDREGGTLALNENWTTLARDGGFAAVRVGDNLLTEYAAEGRRTPQAVTIAAGIAAILDGSQRGFVLDYRTDTAGGPRWWSLSVVPLGSADGGAVITQTDVTRVRRAELDAQRSLEELAHVTRVSTVGQLTASLAHQLNQPLSAIMTNAQAAHRMLDVGVVDFSKLQAILTDIVRDDRRASEIIDRLRKLFQRGELVMTRLNLPSLVLEVAGLVSAEANNRGIRMSLDVESAPAFVLGDHVQLQQVVLNLLQNAMDAVSDQPFDARVVTVRCRRANGDARVSVEDTGPGLPNVGSDTIFEPFYSTKPRGMGVGLSIARSIVEAHGGSVHALAGRLGGALFEVILPIDGAPAL